jgi:uncharacterized membrane protein
MNETLTDRRTNLAEAWLRPVGGAAFVVAICLAVGWVVSTEDGVLWAAIGIAVIVVALVAMWNAGVAAGILLVAVLNGIPGVDLEGFAQRGSFRPSDVLVASLVILLGIRLLHNASEVAADRTWGGLAWWGALFLLWWTWIVASSTVDDGIPLVNGALFGRDFLYFGLLLPLFVGGLRRRDDVFGLLATIAAAALLHACAQLGIVLGIVEYDWLVHPTILGEFEGLTRIYAFMSDAVVATLAISSGLALMGRRRGLRGVGALVALITALSTLFQFTRATYAGLAFGFLVVTAIWVARRQESARPIRRTALVGVGVVLAGAAFVFSGGTGPSLSSASPASAVSERAVSSVQELTTRTGTVGYRYDVSQRMLDRLGDDWLFGLGFWHPDVKPVSNLPQNSIRNGDVGILNAVMTMGVVGTILLYLPLLAATVAFLRRRDAGEARRSDYDWFFYGLSAWLLAVLVGSLTLVQLFSVPGLVLTAAIVAAGIRVLDLARADESTGHATTA